MPSAKERAKATGDTHLPEIEPDGFQAHKARPTGASTPGSRIRASWSNGSAELNERDAPPSDRVGDTRDSAER